MQGEITVLLCEDEPLISMAMAEMLQDAGMTVLEACNARAAIDILSSRRVSVLVTDVGLPDMSGVDLALEARRLHDALPIIFSSGNPRVPGAEAVDGAVVLGKPTRDEEVINAIRQMAG